METQLEKEAKEFNDKMWAEYAESMNKYHTECKRVNDRIIKAVANQLGQSFVNDIWSCVEESEGLPEYSGKFFFLRKPRGQWQEEEYDNFNGIWVDQWSVGDSGDSWNGVVCIKLKKGLWLAFDYSM